MLLAVLLLGSVSDLVAGVAVVAVAKVEVEVGEGVKRGMAGPVRERETDT